MEVAFFTCIPLHASMTDLLDSKLLFGFTHAYVQCYIYLIFNGMLH